MELDNPLYSTEYFSSILDLCYPSSYGSTCSAWDTDLPPYCTGSNITGSNASSVCARQWCYVDYSTCRRSQIAAERSRLFQSSGSGLFYSYETCDGQTSQPASLLVSRAQSVASTMTLTIAVPGNDPPIIFKRDLRTGEPEPEGVTASYYNDTVPWEGALVDFYAEISRRHGASFQFTAISGASMGAYANAWTASGYEASRGAADMGVPIWRTSDRSEMAAFAAPLHMEYFHLYVKESRRDVSVWDRAAFAFLPFSIPLWIVCGLITIAMGAVVSALEARETTANPRALIRGLGRGTYYSLVQLLTGFEAKETSSVPVRILYVGWAFFVCLVLAAYTANFAAFLVKNPTTMRYKTLEAAIELDANIRICHPAAITDAIIADHTGVGDNLVVIPWVADIGPEYEAAECDALIWSEQQLPMHPETMQYFCDESMTKQDLVTLISVAEPVYDSNVGAVLSYWHNSLYQEVGVTYHNYEASYYDRSDSCEDLHSLETSASTIFAQRQDDANLVGRRLQGRRTKLKTGRQLRAGASRGGSVGGANAGNANGDNPEEHSLTIAHFFGPILMWIISVLAAISVRIIVGIPKTLEKNLEESSHAGLRGNAYLKKSVKMMRIGADMITGDEEEEGDAEMETTGKPDRYAALESRINELQLSLPSPSATMTADHSSVTPNDEAPTMYRSSKRLVTSTTVVNDPTSASRVATRPGTPNIALASSAKPTPPRPSTQDAEMTLPRSLKRSKSLLRDRSKDSPSAVSAESVIIDTHAPVSPCVLSQSSSTGRGESTGNGLVELSEGRAQRYAAVIGARQAAQRAASFDLPGRRPVAEDDWNGNGQLWRQ